MTTLFLLSLWFVLGMAWFPCGCGEACVAACPQCEGEAGPCQFEVILADFTDNTCGLCDTAAPTGLLGTYLLDWDSGRVCTWGYDLGATICSSVELKIELEAVGSDVELRVRLWSGSGSGLIQADWLYTCVGCWDTGDLESTFDCYNDGPWSPSLDFGTTQCNYAAGSVTVNNV